jgi:hypothetical protein
VAPLIALIPTLFYILVLCLVISHMQQRRTKAKATLRDFAHSHQLNLSENSNRLHAFGILGNRSLTIELSTIPMLPQIQTTLSAAVPAPIYLQLQPRLFLYDWDLNRNSDLTWLFEGESHPSDLLMKIAAADSTLGFKLGSLFKTFKAHATPILEVKSGQVSFKALAPNQEQLASIVSVLDKVASTVELIL